jgi:hypothetical protein
MSSAQRLAASQVLSHSETTAMAAAPDGAQRLAASQVLSHTGLSTPLLMSKVLNASRHHRYFHSVHTNRLLNSDLGHDQSRSSCCVFGFAPLVHLWKPI